MPMTPFRAAILLLCMALFSPPSGSAQIEAFSESFSGSTNGVTGLPYSAMQETEETQTLPDGTHVVQKHQTRLYRDSSGRTRVEVFVPIDWNAVQKTPEMVMIMDPIAKVMYSLRPSTRSAYSNSLRETPPLPNPQDSPPLLPRPKKMASEDLGTQMMEGVLVKGVRTTWTLPTDSVGNDRPIIEVDEVWTSTDLGLAILSKHSDPRTGETVTRVTSLDRSEPDPTLFQVPPDYTLKEN
jgi:hypothetical protein